MTSSNCIKVGVFRDETRTNTNTKDKQNLPICDLPNCGKFATRIIDTPKQKNVLICDECFKKVNSIAGVLQSSPRGLTAEEIFNEIQGGRF